MKRLSCLLWLLALVAAIFALPAQAEQQQDERERKGHRLELSWGQLEGPGMDDAWNLYNRRISDIDSGEQWRLHGRLQLSERWYLNSTHERSRLIYQNPQGIGCPTIQNVLRIPGFCQGGLPRSSNRVHDDVQSWIVGLGWEQPLTERLGGIIELEHSWTRWATETDVEAVAAARCIYLPANLPTVRDLERLSITPLSYCNPVSDVAREKGFLARVGVRLNLSPWFDVTAKWNIREYKHHVYRNVILNNLIDANADIANPAGRIWTVIPGSDSSSWYSIRADVHVSRHWAGFLTVETGGTRDWTGIDVGIAYRF